MGSRLVVELGLATALVAVALSAPAQAVTIGGYEDRAAFEAATGGGFALDRFNDGPRSLPGNTYAGIGATYDLSAPAGNAQLLIDAGGPWPTGPVYTDYGPFLEAIDLTKAHGDAGIRITFGGTTDAFGFDTTHSIIGVGFDLAIEFADATTFNAAVGWPNFAPDASGTPQLEGAPHFFGFWADQPIASVVLLGLMRLDDRNGNSSSSGITMVDNFTYGDAPGTVPDDARFPLSPSAFPTVVPLPPAALLFASGLLALGGVGRRRFSRR